MRSNLMRNVISTLLRRHLVASEGYLSSSSIAVNKIEKKILFVNKKMEWKFWDRAHNMLNCGLLCSPSLRETNMFAAVGLKLRVQILWVLHHPLNHTCARNTNAPTPTPNLGESHWHGVCRCVPFKVFLFFFSKFGIAISTVEPWWLKSILLNHQVKKKKETRVRNVPIFVRLGVFFTIFEERGEKCTQLLYLGCFF